MPRVLFVAPLEYGHNPTVDAVGHGLQISLAEHAVDLRVIYADFRGAAWPANANDAFHAAVAAEVDAVVAWLVTPDEPRVGVEAARARGIPVITLERPNFFVDGSVVWPNFNQGVYMAQHLATLVAPGAKVAIIGGPDAVDDVELVHGLVHGVSGAGLTLLNDPWLPRHRNISDVTHGGRDAALAVLEDFSHLDALIPFNDETMLGTVEALREVGRLGEPKMVSRNGAPAAVQAVLDGVTNGTWDIEPLTIGSMLADLVISKVIRDTPLDGVCQASPIGRMITPEIASSWIPWTQRVQGGALPEGL